MADIDFSAFGSSSAPGSAPDFSAFGSDKPPPGPSRLQTLGTGVKEFGKSVVEGAISSVGSAVAGLPALDPSRPEYRQLQKYQKDFLRLPDMSVAERNALADRMQKEDPISRRILFGKVKDLLDPSTRAATQEEIRNLQPPTPIKETTLYKTGKQIESQAAKDFPVEPGWENSVTTILGQGLGSVGTGIAASLLTGGAGSAALFTSMGAGQSVESAVAFDDAERKAGRPGLTDEQIAMAGILGTGPGATDSLPIEFLLGKIKVPMPFRKPLAKWIARVGGQAVVEGIQEGGQQYLQNAIEQGVESDPETPTMAVAKPAGLVEAGNIDLTKRPIAKNADGSISTVRSMSIGIDGKEVLIPTVINGKVVSNEEAIAHYEKTGEHLGIFDSEEHANTYAGQLHDQQDSFYNRPSLMDGVLPNAAAGAGVGTIAAAAEHLIETLAHVRGGKVSPAVTPESVPEGAAAADTLYPEAPPDFTSAASETPPAAPEAAPVAPEAVAAPVEAPAPEAAPMPAVEAPAGIDAAPDFSSSAAETPPESTTKPAQNIPENIPTLAETPSVPGETTVEPTPKETNQAATDLQTEASKPAAEIPAFTEDAAAAPPKAGQSAGVYNFDPLDLRVDAKRFQFKSETDTEGVNSTLKDVKNWRAERGNQIIVFQDKAGKLFVADGHQRTGLARRLIEQGAEPDIRIPGVLFRESDGLSAEDLMGIAALKNIAEGSTSPVDAARVLRATGPEALADLPMPREAVRTAVDLSKLGDESWRMVTNEVVDPNYAKYVGRFLPNDQPRQVAAMKALGKADPANEDEAAVLVRRVAASELAKGEAGAQTSMFGEEPDSTALEEVKIVAGAVRQLRGDRKLFSRLVREADRIEATGSRIERENAGAVVSQADRLSSVVETVAFRAGPVRDTLTALAKEVKSGERSLAEARTTFVDALRREEAPAGKARAGAGTVERGAVQEAPAKVEPKAVDFENFASERGAGRGDIGEAGLHRSSKNESSAAFKRNRKTSNVRDAAVVAKREELRREYDAEVAAGRIRPLTRQEELERTAAGHDDNESTQAARRLLEKRKAANAEPEPRRLASSSEKPATEPGAEGKPQLVLPGAEKLTDKELAAKRQAEEIARRQSSKKIAPKVAQKGVSDTGLFGEGEAQKRLLSSLERPTAPPFFSAVLRSVESARLTKATPDQWLGYLKNQSGVKQEELDWLGVGDWLAGQKSVTKEALADFVRANQVEVKEVEKGEGPEPFTSVNDAIEYLAEMRETSPDDIRESFGYIDENDYIKLANEAEAIELGAPKFASYQLPGGENYRELLLTLPRVDKQSFLEWRAERGLGRGPAARAAYAEWNAQQAIANPSRGNFTSSHWDEPNVLAHVRFNEREVNGKRVLFIEEIQSDFGQAVRRERSKVTAAINSDFDAIAAKMVAAGIITKECD